MHLQKEPDRYIIKYCTERIFNSHGNVKVEDLAEETGFTARHIAKLFEKFHAFVEIFLSAKHCILTP